MTTSAPSAVSTRRATPTAGPEQRVADVLVVFGITGDLAKVMTFHSLYRLEQRGLLDCPIVGVAVDDWTIDQLVERARESIEGTGEQIESEVFDRFAARLSYVAGDFADAATYERVGKAIEGAETPVFYLEIPPFLFGRVVKGLAEAGLTETARVVVEKPFGHDLASARELADELHQYIDESQLYRIDHFLGKMGIEEILYLRFANTMLEPVWNRNYVECVADHDGRGFRSRRPRALLRPGRRAPRRRRQPPHAGGRRGSDGAPRRRRPRDDQGRGGRALQGGPRSRPGALRPRPVRGLPATSTASRPARRPRPTPPSGSRSRTGAGRAFPSSSAPASFSRRRRPRSGSSSSARRGSASDMLDGSTEPDQFVVKLDPSTGVRHDRSMRTAPTPPRPSRSPSTWSSPTRAARARPRTRCCSTPHWSGDSTRFTRQDGVEETWRIMQPLLDAPPPVHPYAPGTWGPEAADGLVAGHGRWHGPWVVSMNGRRETTTHAASRARPRHRRSRRSRTTRSSPTATPVPSWRPTGRSTGSASRPSTRRACSAACSTGRPDSSGSGRTGSTIPPPATSSRGRTCW